MSDKELSNSPTKENFDPSTPPRSPLKQRGSPTHKSMWDSGDPSRNPPPLPVSPQMIRVNTSKNNRNLSPNSVGKLQFATIDNSEVEHQLKRIIDAQSNLRSIVVSVDTSVKQTQLDLENLIERSSNNNIHLKDLVQNVKSSIPTEDKYAPTQQEVQRAISEALLPIQEKFDAADKLKKQIFEGLESLNSKAKEPDTSNHHLLDALKTHLADVSVQLENIKSLHSDHSSCLAKLDDKLSNKDSDSASNVHKSIKEYKQSIMDAISKVEISVQELGAKNYAKEYTKKHDEILKQLESLKSPNIDLLESKLIELGKSYESLSKELGEQLKTSQDQQISHAAEITTLIKSSQTDLNKSNSTEKSIADKVTESNSELSKDLKEELTKLHQKMTESNKGFETITSSLKGDLMEKLSTIESKSAALEKGIKDSTKETETRKEIESKDLMIQLKDKQIEELQAKLDEANEKIKIKENIIQLTQDKAKLETKFEHLNEAYTRRYDEFKELSGDYDSLQSKLSNLTLDKMKSILGSAVIMKISNDNNTASPQNNESPRKNVLGNRVLSTNSYLNSNQVQLTPKSKKKYDFEPADEFEEKENI